MGTEIDCFGNPQQLALTSKDWLAIAVLAGLRKASNDPIRSGHRSRGEHRNALNDVQGALAELAVLRAAERQGHTSMSYTALNPRGPVDDVDLTINTRAGPVALETKGLLWSPRKRLFLINDLAHRRSLRRGAQGYVPVLAAPGRSLAIIGRVIPAQDVDSWPIRPFQYGDPARFQQLAHLCNSYFGSAWTSIRAALTSSTSVASRPALNAAYRAGARTLQELGGERILLKDIAASELVSHLSRLAQT